MEAHSSSIPGDVPSYPSNGDATDTSYDLVAFDPHAATDASWAAVHTFETQILTERWPADPPRTLDATVAAFRVLPPRVRLRGIWLLRETATGTVVGMARAMLQDSVANAHLLGVEVAILPYRRRQGLATRLLAPLASFATTAGCTYLLAPAYDSAPSGAAFLRRIGGEEGLAVRMSQLALTGVDRALLDEWLGQAADCTFGIWTGPIPEDALEEVASVLDVVNDQPRGELAVADDHFTPEQIRQVEAAVTAQGEEMWVGYARAPGSRALIGLTLLGLNPREPWLAHQNLTGVLRPYRQRGVGRRLKAQMIDQLLRERPQVTDIRTGNATSNAAMLRINEALGFRPYVAQSLWQASLERVYEYLRARPLPAPVHSDL